MVQVKGKNKIVNITKIKPYHLNRYSKVDKERQLSSSEYKEKAKMIKDAEKKNRKQKNIVESSSSDTETICSEVTLHEIAPRVESAI